MRARMPARQRGVAVITALLLTTLAITIVASLFWQQQVQVRSIENQRLQLQKQWILRGALDWAAIILRADVISTGDANDNLDEPWAVPLAETRLDQYVENGRADGDAADAVLSGSIIDAQSRYNLANLANGGMVNPREQKVFENLLSLLGLSPALARAAADAVAAGQPRAPGPSGTPVDTQPSSASRPMQIDYVDDLLAVRGFTPAVLDKLRKFIIVLPAAAKQINVNTAPAEVLAARIDTLSLAGATALVANRKTAYFRDYSDFLARLRSIGGVNAADADMPKDTEVGVKTQFFLINGKVRMNRAGLAVQALLNRQGATTPKVVWIREN